MPVLIIDPKLADAGYRIEWGDPEFATSELKGKYWWTLCTGGDVMASAGEWPSATAAITDAYRHQREYHGPCPHCEGEGEIDLGTAMERRCPICAGTGDAPAPDADHA